MLCTRDDHGTDLTPLVGRTQGHGIRLMHRHFLWRGGAKRVAKQELDEPAYGIVVALRQTNKKVRQWVCVSGVLPEFRSLIIRAVFFFIDGDEGTRRILILIDRSLTFLLCHSIGQGSYPGFLRSMACYNNGGL